MVDIFLISSDVLDGIIHNRCWEKEPCLVILFHSFASYLRFTPQNGRTELEKLTLVS